jgi:glutamate/tyrosine decarboxylase-like PLP-dependent enzyme
VEAGGHGAKISSRTDLNPHEHTLDPADWEAFRALAHRMVDDMIDQTRALRGQPAWQPPPAAVKDAILQEPLPLKGQSLEQAYADYLHLVQPYTNGNRHPRAWGWVRGNGTPMAAMAEMLAAAINPHLGGGDQSPTYVEERCLQWLAQVMGMPSTTTGILTSGGTMANLLGLAVARHARAGFDLRAEGLAAHAPLTVYASSETHMWAGNAMDLLGLGSRHLRTLPIDESYRMDLTELRRLIREDRAAGLQPIAVIGNAGTVNTGAVDDLEALAAFCREEELWFHVDGAFGALLKLSPHHASLVRGLEQADSLAFDLHKWMYLPFEIGCVLVANGEEHRAAFASTASYLEGAKRGILATGLIFADRGVELTRGFKALKLWMALKAHGLNAFSEMIEQNMEQARYLERRIQEEPELELLAPRSMNIVCYRYRGVGESDEESLNALNRELVLRLQESGEFVVSGTVLKGRYALRIANTNHRSRLQDFEDLVQWSLKIGREIEAEGCAAPS